MHFDIKKISRQNDLAINSKSINKKSIYRILLTKETPFQCFIDGEFLHIPNYSLVYISPAAEVSTTTFERSEGYLLSFSSSFYSKSMNDHLFLHNDLLFNAKKGFTIVPNLMDHIGYSEFNISLLERATVKFSCDIYRDLAHNLVKQFVLIGNLELLSPYECNQLEGEDFMLVNYFKNCLERYVTKHKELGFYLKKLNLKEERLTMATQTVLDKKPMDLIYEFIVKEFNWRLKFTSLSVRDIADKLGFSNEKELQTILYKYNKK
ncbi:hypothetical protein [Sphingobacterium hungaricum]